MPLSTASRPEPDSISGEVPLDDQTDGAGSAARTRSSNRLTSKPGSVAARRSIAAMRFSSCWPFTLLIEPEAIAAWMAVKGSLLESLLSAVAALLATSLRGDRRGRRRLRRIGMPLPDGAIVTVEPALIVSVFCRICVAVRLAAFVPSPTVVLPEYVVTGLRHDRVAGDDADRLRRGADDGQGSVGREAAAVRRDVHGARQRRSDEPANCSVASGSDRDRWSCP